MFTSTKSGHREFNTLSLAIQQQTSLQCNVSVTDIAPFSSYKINSVRRIFFLTVIIIIIIIITITITITITIIIIITLFILVKDWSVNQQRLIDWYLSVTSTQEYIKYQHEVLYFCSVLGPSLVRKLSQASKDACLRISF